MATAATEGARVLLLRHPQTYLGYAMGVMASNPCVAPRQASVVCCGLDNAGKSTILSHLCDDLPSVIHPTGHVCKVMGRR